MFSRKNVFFLFAILGLLVALSGCGSSESAGDQGEATTQGSNQTELIYGRGGDSSSLDPAVVTDMESEKVSQNILETLVTYGEMDLEVNPKLAKDWTYSDDGTVYTFTLQEGIKFHDGTDFNAEAVVYNFERWMNADEEEQGKFATYASVFGGFSGDETHVIKEVKALDEFTVEFTLKQPLAMFLKNLALTPFSISSPEAIETHGESYGENPVGTGPFVFKEWIRNDRIVLDKNEQYWQEGLPKMEQVIFRTIPDSSARLNALMTGEIDMMDGLNPNNIDRVMGEDDLQVFTRPSLNTGYMGFTVNRPPFDNKLVRQALSHAVNKQGIIDAFYAGQATPAKNPMPPAIEGYNDDIQDYQYDLEKTKQLLAEAGYEDGFTMELWAMPVSRPYMPEADKVAEIIQSDYAKIGVDVQIQSVEWATYLEKVVAGEFDAFLLGWTSTNGDADDFLYNLLDKDSIGSLNSSHYINEDLHELLIEGRTTPDQEVRNELYKQAQEIIHDDAPWVPLAHSTPALAGTSNINGFNPHPTGRVDLTGVSIK